MPKIELYPMTILVARAMILLPISMYAAVLCDQMIYKLLKEEDVERTDFIDRLIDFVSIVFSVSILILSGSISVSVFISIFKLILSVINV